jgi:hypothetical protein
MTTRTPSYRILLVKWLGSENQPMQYFEVHCGDSTRDYMMRDYKPRVCVAKFRDREGAESFILAQGGELPED